MRKITLVSMIMNLLLAWLLYWESRDIHNVYIGSFKSSTTTLGEIKQLSTFYRFVIGDTISEDLSIPTEIGKAYSMALIIEKIKAYLLLDVEIGSRYVHIHAKELNRLYINSRPPAMIVKPIESVGAEIGTDLSLMLARQNLYHYLAVFEDYIVLSTHPTNTNAIRLEYIDKVEIVTFNFGRRCNINFYLNNQMLDWPSGNCVQAKIIVDELSRKIDNGSQKKVDNGQWGVFSVGAD